MKKLIISFILISFLLFKLIAFSNITHVISSSVDIDVSRERNLGGLSAVSAYNFISSYLTVDTAVKTSAANMEMSIFGMFLPVKISIFSCGFYTGYNIDLFKNYCVENNLVLGSKFILGNSIQTCFDISYLLKLTSFYKLKTIPVITDHTIAAAFTIQSAITKQFLLAVKIASYDKFYYPLFFHPYYEIRGSWIMTENLKLDMFFGVRYSDMFTLTAYLSQMRLGVIFSFTLPHFKTKNGEQYVF